MNSYTLQLFEFGAYQPLPEAIDLAHFKSYLIQVWHNRQLFYEPIEETEENLEEKQAIISRQGQALLQFDGNEIRARNYAGFIHYQGTTIHILPKIFSGTGIPPTTVFEHLLFYLSYAAPMRFPFAEQKADTAYQDDFLQLLIHFFAVLTEKTLAMHPYHTYEEVKESSAFVRGRIDIDAYTRQSLSSGQWQDLQVRYSPFVYDNAFNQLVRYTVQLLLPVAAARTLPVLQELLFILHEVSDTMYTYEDCEKIAFSNLPAEHQQVLSVCKLFLANQQVHPSVSHTSNFSFLVPMERVFEEFTGHFIKKHFPEILVQLQSATAFATHNRQIAFQVYNDIWLPISASIIDTKYKLLDLDATDSKKTVLPSDLYQMLAYAIRRKSAQVHLIYPGTEKQVHENFVYEIEDRFNGQIIKIHIHQIPMIVPGNSNFEREQLVALLTEKLQAILYG